MDALYSVMQGLESRLGGGEGVEGIYGSITATGMHKVLECLRINCDLRERSVLVDIGAGLGRPLLHALLLHNIAHAYGVELDRVKVAKADAFCKGVLEELISRGIISDQQQQQMEDTCNTAASQQPRISASSRSVSTTAVISNTSSSIDSRQSGEKDSAAGDCDQIGRNAGSVAASAGGGGGGGKGRKAASSKAKGSLRPPHSTPIITCAAIEQIQSLDPATHAYSFWEGVPLCGKHAFGRLFRQSTTLKAVAVVQRAIRGEKPESYMRALGFGPLQLIAVFPVNMSGSGRSFQAYVFSKTKSPLELLHRHGTNTAKTPVAAAAGDATPTKAAAAAGADCELRVQIGEVAAAAVSCTKPPRGRKLPGVLPAAANAYVGSIGGSSGEIETQQSDDSDVENLDPDAAAAAAVKLVPLLTEELIRQQQQQLSPQKRVQGYDDDVAAAAAAGAGVSPAKKQRGCVGGSSCCQQQQQHDHLAVASNAAVGSGYGLRRRLVLGSSSSGAGGCTAASSRAVTAAAAADGGGSRPRRVRTSAAKQQHQQRLPGNAKSMSVSIADTTVPSSSRRSTAASSSSGSRSTAVSGGSRQSARGASATAGGSCTTAAAAAAVVEKAMSVSVVRERGARTRQQQSTISAAISAVRAAVSTLGM